MTAVPAPIEFPHRHLLGIEGLSPDEITHLLDRSDSYVALNPAKQTAASGSKWAIRNFFKTKQINPRLTNIEVVNNLFAARYMRVSLEPDQETRLEHYDSIELANVMELVMATLDIELDVNPLHNLEGFVDAAMVVEKELVKAGIHTSDSEHDFEDKWNRLIAPQR